jgi:zinc protease
MRLIFSFFSLLTLATNILATAQILPFDPNVRTGKLTNGFRYYIRHNEEPRNRVTFYLAGKMGSILETDEQQGLAHFMEHMSFNGTKHFPKNELVEYLQKSGVRFGADLNAYTSFDETVYKLPIPSNDPELLKNGLQIMRDWAGEATLDPGEIDKERGVVLEEKRLRKGAGERLQTKLFPFQVNGSHYGKRLPIGAEQVLTTFKKEAIQSFCKDWYRPDLEALIVVGDVDVNAMERQIKALFSDMKNPVNEKARPDYKATLLNKNRFLSLTDPELPQTSVEIDFKTKALGQGTKANYKASLLRNLCSQLLSGRLSDISKSANAPVLNVQDGYGPVIKGLDALQVEFNAKDKQLKQGFDFIYAALLQIKQYGFIPSEIDRVKKAYQSQLAALLREKDKQNSIALADELKRHFLTGEPAPGIAYENKLVAELLPQLTETVINREIRALLGDNNRDIILLAPKSPLPDEQMINSWIEELNSKTVTAYTEKATNGTLISSIPSPGKMVGEVQDKQLGITTWMLSNGAKVVLKPTTFKNDEVFFHAFSAGGTSTVKDADYESAANAAGILAASGLGEHDAVSLRKLLSGKQIRVQPYINERFEGLQGMSSKADLKTAMELTYLYFTSPRKDTAMFSNIISGSGQVIANRYSNPQAVFQDSVSSVLGNYNNRRTGPSLQKLESIQLDKAYQLYKERFADAGDFTFIFIGSFRVDELRPFVEQYIASLPGGGKPEQAKDLGIRIPAGQITKKIFAGKEDKATVLLVYSGSYTFSPEENVRLAALQDVIQFRMNERLRETEGGAYAPSVRFQREHGQDDRYQLVINFGCAPANVDKLTAAALEEIEKIKNHGPEADDLQKFHAEESRQLELNKQNNQYWLSYLTTKLQNGENVDALLSQEQRIKAVTGMDIQRAAKKYVSGQNLIKFIALPESEKVKTNEYIK